VRETSDLRVANGNLVLPTSKTDLIWPGDPKLTENIVLQPLPGTPLTATARLTLAARQGYQQAGLVVYGDDDNYAKMVFQARGSTADARRFQFMREDNGQPSGKSTTDLGAAYPDSVWVRFTSDGRFLRAAYSSDGVQFTDMLLSEALDGIANPKIGIISMAGSRGDTPVIDAKFDWFELCPAQPARP
jgi:regulation of enolase protein 1 (concanavalin A-like superfamily)